MENSKCMQDNEILVHKIGKCISASLKPIDYFIGFAPFNFQFVIEEYKGETLFSEKISPLEQAIVGILSIDDSASIERIGSILGFNVIQDIAEYNILSDAIKVLAKHRVIEGDDSLYCLTNEGKVFASEGKRPEKDIYDFKLWYNKSYPELTSLKEILDADNIIEEESPDNSIVSVNLDLIRNIAARQAPKVHNPDDERILLNAELIKSSSYSYMLYACFIRNVLTGDIKTIVFDDSQNVILDDFSRLIDGNDTLKANLFDSILESVFIPDEAQVKEIEKIENADDNEIEVDVIDGSEIQKLHKKALYDEIAFENELNHIFTDDKPDEIWLISPWIGYFFVQYRAPMIEKVLKEGTKVFIAYSKRDPRDKNHTEMVHALAQKEIDRLSETYHDFFCIELPKIFHTKNVLEVKNEQIIMFSGSFNILSFAIQESHKIIRGEQMAFVNPQKAKSEYRLYIDTFADVYIDIYKRKLADEATAFLHSLKDNKLKYFSMKSTKSSEIDDILDCIDKKQADIQKEEWLINVNKLHKMVTPLLARGIITGDDKKYLRKNLSLLEESAKMLDLDEELISTFQSLQGYIEKLKVRESADKIVDEKGKSVSTITEDFSAEIQKLYQTSGTGRIRPENVKYARNVLKNKKLSTDHQLIRYIVSLNLMLQAIKKKAENAITFRELNSCVVTLIEKTENKCPNLSIFIQNDVTFFDIAGIQISFFKVPHTEKTNSIIVSRNNKTTENKRQKMHVYADELFNIVFKRV